MNVFRSLARAFWNAIDFSRKPAADEGKPPDAAPRKDVMARPAFRPSAGGDGFEVAPRTASVDLSGGVKLKYEVLEEAKPTMAPAQSDFVASLDDLGLLIDELKQPDPAPLAPWEQASVEPLDAFEDPAPLAEPLDFFEDSPPVDAEPPVAAELPVAAAPVPVAAAQPTAESPTPQYAIDLLLRVGAESAVQRRAVEEFSTLELIDTVEQLSVVAPTDEDERPAPADQLAVEVPKA